MKKYIKPGEIYEVGEPELVGKLPIRSEFQVQSSDTKALGWTCQAFFSGYEVYINEKPDELLTSKDAIKPGDKILVMHIFGNYITMTVFKDKFGELNGENEYHIGLLSFAEDSRNCWTCPTLINKKVFGK